MDVKEILKHVDHTLLKQTATWEDIKQILRHRADQEFIVLHARGLPRRVHRELGQADVHRC